MTRETNYDFPFQREKKRTGRDPFERSGYRLRSPNRSDFFDSDDDNEKEAAGVFHDRTRRDFQTTRSRRSERDDPIERDFVSERDYPVKHDFPIPRPRRQVRPAETVETRSLTLFFRNAVLAASFVVITLLAVYWEKLPVLTAQAKTFLRLDGVSMTEPLVDHQAEGEGDDGESAVAFSETKSAAGENGSESEQILALDRPNLDSSDEKEAEELAKIQEWVRRAENDSGTPHSNSASGEETRAVATVQRSEPPLVPASDTGTGTETDLSDLHPLETGLSVNSNSKFISETEAIPPETVQYLKNQGVKNGKLQRWGEGGRFWRYSCEAEPLSAGAGFSKYFEAVGHSSEEVIETVIMKVQQWRGNQAFL